MAGSPRTNIVAGRRKQARRRKSSASASSVPVEVDVPEGPDGSEAEPVEGALLNLTAVMIALEQVLVQLDRQAEALGDLRRRLNGAAPAAGAAAAPPPRPASLASGLLADPRAVSVLTTDIVRVVYAGAPHPISEAAAARDAGAEVTVCDPSAIRCEGVQRAGVPVIHTLLGPQGGMSGYDPMTAELFDTARAALIVPVTRLDELLPRGSGVILVADRRDLASLAVAGAEHVKIGALAMRGEDVTPPESARLRHGVMVLDEPGRARGTAVWFATAQDRARLLDWCAAELPSEQFATL